MCEKESENKAMEARIKRLEKEVDDHKQWFLHYKEHVLTVTKQRKNENKAYTSTVNNLEHKCAELKQQVGIQYIKIF